MPLFIGAAAAGALAYAFSRQSKLALASGSRSVGAEPALRERRRVLRAVGTAEALALDLDGVFDANSEDALDFVTVHGDTHVSALASADDAEPPAPEDLGAYWLTRATDSERSRDESDLEVDIDGLRSPDEVAEFDEQEEREEGEALAVKGTESG
jgi:hypothetical protein